MKCRICGEELHPASYRKLYDFVNFPAHGRWSTCRDYLLQKDFDPIYERLPEIVSVKAGIPPEFDDLVKWLNRPQDKLELLMRSDELGDMIDTLFPFVQLEDIGPFIPVGISLPREIMQKLVGNELMFTEEQATQLKNTTTSLFHTIQKDGFPLKHPMYYSSFPESKSHYVISVPANLQQALNYQWIRQDKALERVLWIYSDQLEVPSKIQEVAYSVLNNRIHPRGMKQQLRRAQYMSTATPVPCVKIDGLPSNKRNAIKNALNDETLLNSTLLHLVAGIDTKKKTTIRVDFEDEVKLRQRSAQSGIPIYKLTTALLLSQSQNNV